MARLMGYDARFALGFWEKCSLLRPGPRLKQLALTLGVLDTPAGDVEVARLNLDPDELAAELGAGYAGRAAAHEWIQDTAERLCRPSD